jgi:RimJ/RimL family protein N-acetyltransferase
VRIRSYAPDCTQDMSSWTRRTGCGCVSPSSVRRRDAQDMLASQRDGAFGRAGDQWVQLSVVDRADGTVHGDCAARVLTTPRDTAEVGVTFATASQGRGLATEAMSAIVDSLFDDHGMHRVFAETDDRNAAVHRLFERLGFRCEGLLVDADWCKGEWVTLRLFAVLATEWATRHP